jgi:hypothetical protein
VRAIIRQHYVATACGVARDASVLAGDFWQLADMVANDVPAVTIEGTGEPRRAAISKWTAGIKMIEPRGHKLNESARHSEIPTHWCERMSDRNDSRRTTIAAEARRLRPQRLVLWQSHNFVIVFGKPSFKVSRFALALLMSKSATDEPGSHNQTGVRREDHVGQARLWFYRFDATGERL